MRALIRKNAAKRAKKWLDKEVPPTKGTSQFKLFLKQKPIGKGDRPTKKPKEVVVFAIEEKPPTIQVPLPPRHGAGKGLMMAQGPIPEKCPLILHKDPQHAVGLLSSIIKDDNYEDLGNHATEAMGEMSLFGLAQVYNSLFFLSLLICSILFLTVS